MRLGGVNVHFPCPTAAMNAPSVDVISYFGRHWQFALNVMSDVAVMSISLLLAVCDRK